MSSKRNFYVYYHCRPDGSVFYIGKGTRKRSKCISKNKRNNYYNNTVAKYGAENIIKLRSLPLTEEEAFFFEIEEIAHHRRRGSKLCNLTDGGEGNNMTERTEAQKAALAKGRGVNKYKDFTDETKKRIVKCLKENNAKWRESEEGRATIIENCRKMREAAAKKTYDRICHHCGTKFVTKSNIKGKRFCANRCKSRHIRANRKG